MALKVKVFFYLTWELSDMTGLKFLDLSAPDLAVPVIRDHTFFYCSDILSIMMVSSKTSLLCGKKNIYQKCSIKKKIFSISSIYLWLLFSLKVDFDSAFTMHFPFGHFPLVWGLYKLLIQ